MSRMHYEFEMSLKSSDEDIEEWAQAVAGDDACGYEVIRRHGHWATLKAEADYGKTNEALNVYPIYSVSDKGKNLLSWKRRLPLWKKSLRNRMLIQSAVKPLASAKGIYVPCMRLPECGNQRPFREGMDLSALRHKTR